MSTASSSSSSSSSSAPGPGGEAGALGDPRPHIAFVLPALFGAPSGAFTYYLNLFRLLRRWRYRASLVLAGDRSRHRLAPEIAREHLFLDGAGAPEYAPHLACAAPGAAGATLLADSAALRLALQQLRPDVVWCTEHAVLGLQALYDACRQLDCALVVALHHRVDALVAQLRSSGAHTSDDRELLRTRLPLLFSGCDLALVSGPALAQDYLAHQWRPRRGMLVQITPVDEPHFRPAFHRILPSCASAGSSGAASPLHDVLRRHLSDAEWPRWREELRENEFWLHVGKLEREEDCLLLRDVWACLLQRTAGAGPSTGSGAGRKRVPALLVVGTGTLLDALRVSQAPEDAARRRWTLLPRALPREELAVLYQSARGLVACNTHVSFGYAWLEAALCACPLLLRGAPGAEPQTERWPRAASSCDHGEHGDQNDHGDHADHGDHGDRSACGAYEHDPDATADHETSGGDSLLVRPCREGASECGNRAPAAAPHARPLDFGPHTAVREWSAPAQAADWIERQSEWTLLAARKALHMSVSDFQERQLVATAQTLQRLVHLRCAASPPG